VPGTSVVSAERNPGLRSTTLKALLVGALDLLGRANASASLVLTGDEMIRALNRDYRETDKATDVLSFPLADPEALEDSSRPVFLGEIYVSLPTARRQARAARRPFSREVAHLAIHGLLHLLGHDHATRSERARMTALERRLLHELRAEILALEAKRP
jgi:probable rRNA maturation factor